jgi:hypothetical protein
MTCTVCGSPHHTRSPCPRKDALKRIALTLAALLLTGCAGLSVNFDAAVSYRSDVPLGQRKQ